VDIRHTSLVSFKLKEVAKETATSPFRFSRWSRGLNIDEEIFTCQNVRRNCSKYLTSLLTSLYQWRCDTCVDTAGWGKQIVFGVKEAFILLLTLLVAI
jgi:hypothetical protein